MQPESRVAVPRGENQLYRVEIHASGVAGGTPGATFKWSRDNGAITFPIRTLSAQGAELEHLGRDDRSTLQPGDWVELIDDELTLRDRMVTEPPPLRQIAGVDRLSMRVDFEQQTPVEVDPARNAYLRRWDHGRRRGKDDIGVIRDDGSIDVREDAWLALEDGVWIMFHKTDPKNRATRVPPRRLLVDPGTGRHRPRRLARQHAMSASRRLASLRRARNRDG